MQMQNRHTPRRTSDTGALFERHGYSIIPSFFSASEVAATKERVAGAVESATFGIRRANNDLIPLRWSSEIVLGALSSDERRAALEATLGASSLRWLSAYVTTKKPHSPALWWHQDWWCWDHPSSYLPTAPQVAILCYLSDTSEDNGALRVIPGSHRQWLPLHDRLPESHSADANALPPSHVAMTESPAQRTLSLRAGDAVVMDYRLLHGTHPNNSAASRDAIHLSIIPNWQDTPEDLKAHLVSHPALPAPDERSSVPSFMRPLIPDYSGAPHDVALNRVPPAGFAIH